MHPFSMILWRDAEEPGTDLLSIFAKAYDTLNVFSMLPMQYQPNFLTSSNSKTYKQIIWSPEWFFNELYNGVNKQGKKKFASLGYSFTCYSSQNVADSFAYYLRVGNTNKLFYNSFTVQIPPTVDMSNEFIAESIVRLFVQAVYAFDPVWGCVSNNKQKKGKISYFSNGIPTSIHWLNYWSPQVIERIGEKHINLTMANFSQSSFHEGFLRVKETAPNLESKEEVMYLEMLEKRLLDIY